MRYVYILQKHPRHPYTDGHLQAAVVVGVFLESSEPKRIADEKNSRRPLYLWTVSRKAIKEAA